METDELPSNSTTSGAFNYVVTAQKPTGVVASLVGNFMGSETLDLIVGCDAVCFVCVLCLRDPSCWINPACHTHPLLQEGNAHRAAQLHGEWFGGG